MEIFPRPGSPADLDPRGAEDLGELGHGTPPLAGFVDQAREVVAHELIHRRVAVQSHLAGGRRI